MKPLKTKAKVRPVEPEQESYPVYSKKLSEWIDAFVDYQEGIGRRPITRTNFRERLKYWRKYLDEIALQDLAEVTPQVMAGYQNWLYGYRSRYGRPLAVKTQIGILNALQVFYRFLHTSGRIPANPAVAIHLPKEPKRLPGTVLSSKEMKKLLKQPDTSTVLGFRDRTMYEVLYSTGLRVRELTRCRVQDLDFSEALLSVIDGKGQKDRVVPLGKTACNFLAEYLDRIRPLLLRSKSKSAIGNHQSEISVVFLNRLGKPWHISGVEKKLDLYAQRAGLNKHVTVHAFRHTLATEMLRRGADLRQIQELLGHMNLRTTQIYTHIVKGELRRVQSQCHPREQVELPEGFTHYRGRKWLTDEDRKAHHRASRGVARKSEDGQP